MKILVTGATGYVGGRLVPLLLERGYRVRALVRNARKLGCRPWAGHENLEIVEGDLHDVESLSKALEECWIAYYLVHSMTSRHHDFKDADRKAAYNMVKASRIARNPDGTGLERIIYLSGLAPKGTELSPHLRSRAEVAEILSLGEASVTTLQAAQIIGSGSASFELVRYLVDRLPVMITPRWVRNQCQPIAISNVLEYLAGVLTKPETTGETYDIGGPDVLTYTELFHIYAEEAGLRKRLIIPVPVLTPKLSSLWVNLVTPVPTVLARPLVEGLKNRVVCDDDRIREIIPQELVSVREGIRRAVDRIRQHEVPTCWTDAGNPEVPEWLACGDADYAGGTILSESMTVRLNASVEETWKPIRRIGGDVGWYQSDFLWRLRGFMDKLSGGPGLRRGRRDQEHLLVGDALDFWRVLDVRETGNTRRLLLLAEMKVPGDALLEFVCDAVSGPIASPDAKPIDRPVGDPIAIPDEPEASDLTMTAYFLPRGLAGILYWYAVLPLHSTVFGGMLKAIARKVGKPVLKGPWKNSKDHTPVCRFTP